ncbi:MAG: hypothetical protein VB122_06790, partial [Erysipelotrichales bacterium]|nr:hypothetical protein [Erysipelotrichales bacterium]
MAQSESLRNRFEQHKPKNQKSKVDDKRIYTAMLSVQLYLERKFGGTPEVEYEDREFNYSRIVENIMEANEIARKKHPSSIDEYEKSSLFQVNENTMIASRGGIDQYKKSGYYIEFEKSISIKYMIDNVKEKGIRTDFDFDYIDRKIIPDGGVLFLR